MRCLAHLQSRDFLTCFILSQIQFTIIHRLTQSFITVNIISETDSVLSD